jgi:hypothetical protein
MSHPDIVPHPAEPAAVEEETGVVAVDVVGTPSHARFPGLCIRCAGQPSGTIAVTKLYWRDNGDSPSTPVLARVDAPACAGCIRAHQGELRPIPPEVKRRLLRNWLVAALPYIVPLGINLWILTMLGPNLLEALAEGDRAETVVWGAVCALFGLLALMFLWLIRRAGRPLVHLGGYASPHVRVERGPLGSLYVDTAEPTSVQRAMDFSDDESEMFEPERHRFTFRNRQVAAEFAELNADRDWDPASTRAQLARRARRALFALVVLGVIWALVAEFF